MRIADAHADVLYQLRNASSTYAEASFLQAGYQDSLKAGVSLQVFALFANPQLSPGEQLRQVLEDIGRYQRTMINTGYVQPIFYREDLFSSVQPVYSGILSLEGAACLYDSPEILQALFSLGVRGVGLTWNGANSLADGCREERNAGLTRAGKQIVSMMEELQMWIDIAHLADAGVFDVFSITKGIVMASHANLRKIHEHPRNLTDDTVREIVRRDGWLGLTFEASFVAKSEAGLEDFMRHVDHALSLGCERHLGFGSDFDGTSHALQGLATVSDYPKLAERLDKEYGRELAEKILYGNFLDFLSRQLPSRKTEFASIH